MKPPRFDSTFLKSSRRCRAAAGSVWTRIEDDQAPLVRDLTRGATSFNPSVGIIEAQRWALSGETRPSFPAGFKLDHRGIIMQGANRWGFFTGVVDTTGYLGDPPLLINDGGEPRYLLTTDGTRVTIQPGGAFDADPGDDLITLRVSGRVTYIPGAAPLPENPNLAPGMLDLFGGSRVVGLRTDRLTDPRGASGVSVAALASASIPGTSTITQARVGLIDGSNQLILDGDGDPYLDPEAPASADLYLVLVPFSMWVIPNPTHWKPATLVTSRGLLFEGIGFVNGEGCIHVFDAPHLLWPEGHCVFGVSSYVGNHPQNFALRSNLSAGGGFHTAVYRRIRQSAGSFFRACCDAAGQPVADHDIVVRSVENHGNRVFATFDDGSSLLFEGPMLNRPGDKIVTGSAISGSLSVRCAETHGPDWYRNRPWGIAGLSIRNFWTFADPSILIKDRAGWVRTYLDPGDGTTLRAKVELHGDPLLIDEFWSEFEARERGCNTSWATDVLGLTAPDEEHMMNAFGILFEAQAAWSIVIEGALGSMAPQRWRNLEDFAQESKPAGSVVVVAPTFFF